MLYGSLEKGSIKVNLIWTEFALREKMEVMAQNQVYRACLATRPESDIP
jgi:hypothetical protein